MNTSLLASVILIAFVALAGLGLFMPIMGHRGHALDCPFAPGGTVLCTASITHIKHWQDAFVTTLVETLLLVGIALAFAKSINLYPKLEQQYERYRSQMRTSIRPPLSQELYSQGILNRKAP